MSDIAAGALPISTGPETTDYLVGEFSGATGRAEISAILALGGGSSGGGGSSTLGGDTDIDFTGATAGSVLGVNPVSFVRRQRVYGTIVGTGNGTTATVTATLGESALANSLLIAYLATNCGVFSAPTGFTEAVYSASSNASNTNPSGVFVFQKTAAGGESSVSINIPCGNQYAPGDSVLVVEEWTGAQLVGATAGTNYATGANTNTNDTLTLSNVPAGSVAVAIKADNAQQGAVSGWADFYEAASGNESLEVWEQTVATTAPVSFTFTQTNYGLQAGVLLYIGSTGNKPYAFVPQSSGVGSSSDSSSSEIVPLTFANAQGTIGPTASDGSFTVTATAANQAIVADQTFDLSGGGKFLEIDLLWSYPGYASNGDQVIGIYAVPLGSAATPAAGMLPASGLGPLLSNYNGNDAQLRIGAGNNRVVDNLSQSQQSNLPFFRQKLRVIPISSTLVLYECYAGDVHFNWYATEAMQSKIYVAFGPVPQDANASAYTIHRFTARVASLTTSDIDDGIVAAAGMSSGSSTTPSTGTSYSSTVLADSPSVYYNFAESSGTTATDSSGNGHNGTYVGTVIYGCSSLVHDAGDYSVGLNGAQYATCPVPPTGSFTVELVVLATNINTYGRFFGTDIYSSSTGFIFSLAQNPATQPPTGFVVTFNTTGSSIANVAVGTGLIYANSRMHVALTYDGTTLKIYINGGLAYSATLSGTYKPSATYNVVAIGSDPSGVDSLSGFMDEFALYPTALTQARIQAHVAAAGI